MEEWQNEIAAVFKDLTALFDGFRLELTELVEEVTTEAQDILNLQWDELKEVITELWQEFELEFEEPAPFNWDISAPPKPIPDPIANPACVGCVYYDGSTYGGNLLVCGMHPYGSSCATCSDWMGENDLDLN